MCAPPEQGEEIPPYTHRVVRGGEEAVGDVLEWGPRQHPVVNQVLGQDVDLVEHVQKGMRSRGFRDPLFSSDERRIVHYHRTIDELIRGRPLRDLIATSPVEPDAGPGQS